MSPRPDRAKGYLHDILDTARLIQTATQAKTLADYQAEIALRHQVERELTIIGEALARLKNHDPRVAAHITGADGYIGLRNILNHQYPDIDQSTIWRTITSEIPLLIRDVSSLLREA